MLQFFLLRKKKSVRIRPLPPALSGHFFLVSRRHSLRAFFLFFIFKLLVERNSPNDVGVLDSCHEFDQFFTFFAAVAALSSKVCVNCHAVPDLPNVLSKPSTVFKELKTVI